uniref:Glucan endo-1,3-beta-D-glucosidase n=1 Tax=Leersia perrieri TaxID=77586 RepID=A0A0D9VA61_9ORYZ
MLFAEQKPRIITFLRLESLGVCYGVHGNNLPSRTDVVQLYRSKGINKTRIYYPDKEALNALRNSGIALILDVGGFDAVSHLATSRSNADAWVHDNVRPYYKTVNIKYIVVGNEHPPGNSMCNVNAALAAAGLGNIKVSTAIDRYSSINTNSQRIRILFAKPYMTEIARYLASTNAPLLANVYPYFAYKEKPRVISLNYATFGPGAATSRTDSPTRTNLFDAMMDAIYAALEKAGAGNMRVVVSESGWPSAEGLGASIDNARAYNQGLIDHVGRGTPKRPGALETYLFAMFNENLKSGDTTERNFGLFYPNKAPVYPIKFN